MQPGYSLRTFTGHSSTVMSLDFHPNKDDLICSCDGDGEIRYWSINNGSCARVWKVENVNHYSHILNAFLGSWAMHNYLEKKCWFGGFRRESERGCWFNSSINTN